jgi:hypothetical protein
MTTALFLVRVPFFYRLPMFGFTAFAFLVVCAIIALATFLVFKSGEQGTTKLSGCAGCAVGFALIVVAGLATFVTFVVMVSTVQGELVRNGPLRKLELHMDDRDEDDEHDAEGKSPEANESTRAEHAQPPETGAPGEAKHDADHLLHLTLTVRGKEAPAAISEWIRENTNVDVTVTMTTKGDTTVIDYGFPMTREQLKELRQELRDAIPGMQLPKDVEIEVKDPDE